MQDPGVAVSYGIEHELVRWSLGLSNLKQLLDAAVTEQAAIQSGERISN